MKPHDPAQARRRLSVALGAFLAAQVAFGLLLDYRWPLLRFPSAQDVASRMTARPTGPDVITLGSSRLAEGLLEEETASLLERECCLSREAHYLNAAVPGGDFVTQRWMIKQLLDAGARPRLVTVEVGPEFFNWYSYWAGMNGVRFLRWDDLPQHGLAAVRSPGAGPAVMARLVPVYQHRGQIQKLIGSGFSAPLAFAAPNRGPARPSASTAPVAWDELLSDKAPVVTEETMQAAAQGTHKLRSSWFRSYRVTPEKVEAVKEIIRRCRDAGADVVLLTAPVSTAYRDCWTPEIESAYQAVLAELGCRHVDCRDWMEDGWFYDSHHLTGPGAERYTRLFVRRVLAPTWKRSDWVSR